MYADRSVNPMDLPAPPTPDEAARVFGLPLLTLADQPAVEESGIGISSATHNDDLVMSTATVSFTLWRNPENRDDPLNLAELSSETRSSLDTLPPWPLPEWILMARERMRYPAIWEAVRTTYLHLPAEAEWHTPEYALVDHVNYVVGNCFREQRVHGDFPGEVLGAASERAIEHDVPIMVDGAQRSGMRIDTDPHVLGVGVQLADCILTAAIDREQLPSFRLEFVTRAAAQ